MTSEKYSEDLIPLPSPLDLGEINRERNKIHSFFRFPGSFHPPLVNMLLKKHEESSLVGDPMVGSGCVAVEAIAEGRDIVSLDIDPLSCLITKVKSDPTEPEEYKQLIQQWLELSGPLPTADQTKEIDTKDLLQQLETTDYSWPPNIFHWFEPYVAACLAKLLIALSDFSLHDRFRNLLEATLASIIRRVSRADPQPVSGLEVTKIMKKRLERGILFDVSSELRKRSEMLAEGFQHLLSLDSLGTSRVLTGDVRNDWYQYCHKHNFELDLIITSPPYCNAIEYWRRHRLEYFWLGLLSRDQIRKKSRKFIGSTTLLQEDLEDLDDPKIKDVCSIIQRIEDKGKIRKSRLLRTYFLDMEKWIPSVLSTLNSNGTAYIVVGPSKSYGVYIDTPKFVADMIHLEGYRVETFLKYSLRNQRMQYPTRNGAKVKTETAIRITK